MQPSSSAWCAVLLGILCACGEADDPRGPSNVTAEVSENISTVVKVRWTTEEATIGYVEYAYAKQNKLKVAKMVNRDGKAVLPNDDSFKAAAAGADWNSAPGMALLLTHQPGAQSWPMTGATFILMHTTQAKPENAKEVLRFFSWAYANGGSMAAELDYVPMPPSVVLMIQSAWKQQIKDPSGQSVY